MSEYSHVEKPFLDQLDKLGWTEIDQGVGVIPSDPAASLRTSFRNGCCRMFSGKRCGRLTRRIPVRNG